ncbi:MAG TPA: PQQ-dependent sugar dehydrogenase [Gemmatimonadaceae bacterium]|nr:PQQ-dependent sugar dehydrogenase [Gemmatimonadaceae bacterium]
MKMAVLLLALSCSGNGSPGDPAVITPPNVDLALQPVASGLISPVHLASPPNDARLFIVEQRGRIRIVQNGQLLATPFLDITAKVMYGGEQGLLSVAFHPQYATNRHFYVYYTDQNGDILVERYTATSASSNTADPASAQTIIGIPHPTNTNHNGGQLVFGPDGFLYIGTGDGGAGNDPPNNAQNRNVLLGKILRLDVNPASSAAYSIPTSNPFVSQSGARGEIWAYGLRNPWRFSFDRGSSTIYIGDVGQNSREEIDAVALTPSGRNFGWRIMEGAQCRGLLPCDQSGLTLPVHDYATSDGNCAVTGGFVYRGAGIPQITGVYFFSDYCKGELRSFRLVNGAATEVRVWPVSTGATITSFGEDSSGELYMISHGGTISKLVRAP